MLSSIPLIISTLNDRRFPRGGETPIAYLTGTQAVMHQGFVPSFFRIRFSDFVDYCRIPVIPLHTLSCHSELYVSLSFFRMRFSDFVDY